MNVARPFKAGMTSGRSVLVALATTDSKAGRQALNRASGEGHAEMSKLLP
jgi:hypothetical protein